MNCSEIESVLVVDPGVEFTEAVSVEHKTAWRLLGWTLSLTVSGLSWALIGAGVSHLLR